MSRSQQMMDSHPASTKLDSQAVAECIDACLDCEQACTTCADACVNEAHVKNLLRCIRTDLDCADICTATMRILSRLTDPDVDLVRAQLDSLATACTSCAQECEQHASMHDHCRICAEACRRCAQTCRDVLGKVAAGAA